MDDQATALAWGTLQLTEPLHALVDESETPHTRKPRHEQGRAHNSYFEGVGGLGITIANLTCPAFALSQLLPFLDVMF
jgi:hypothetical protein